MSKKILFGQDVQEDILAGTKILHDAVATTLGPRGRNVGIDRGYDTWIVHDGVSVAQQVELEDEAQNFAVRVLRETANKQVQTVGDGTTVSIILANAILKEAIKATATGTNPMSLRSGLEKGRDDLLEALKKEAITIKTKEQTVSIATISAEDETLGKQVGELLYDLGPEGVVDVQEAQVAETYIERQEGMQFDKGYISPAFITDAIRMEATVENAKILLTDKQLQNINEMLPLLQQFEKEGIRHVVMIAPDITDTVLASMIVTKMRGGMNVLCVKAPYAGQQQKDFLDDIAVLTGGVVISQETGIMFQNVTLEMLGEAKRVTSTQDATTIVGGYGDRREIDARIKAIKTIQKRNEGSDYQKEKLRERIAKLSNGIAVVNVGGHTEVETKERLERAKDAVAATQAALREGIVPGGEVIYLLLRHVLKDSLAERILYNALEMPFHMLLTNAGMKPDAYLWKHLNHKGVNVVTGKVVDMIDEGIIDPALVAKEAIKNAVSTAIQLMTTEVLILQKEDEKQQPKST